MHGKQDDIVPVEIAQNYYKQLKSNNIKSQLMTIENEGHEIFLSDTVLAVLVKNLKKNQNNEKNNEPLTLYL
jgi:dipeptidyl aminopeptidase/acylaminoacyl peptidase